MIKYVALLRGIGPTNPNMRGEKFRGLFEELGFSNVQTVLASGNVLFESQSTDAGKLSEIIEKALPKKLGFNSTAIIRSQSELQSLVNKDPFKGLDHNKTNYLLFTFFKNTREIPFKLPHTPDKKPFRVLGKIDDCIYGQVNLEGAKTPDYMAWLEKTFGKDITSRTPNTIQLILNKMGKPS